MTLDLFDEVPGEVTFDVDKALDYAADQVIAECQVDVELRDIVFDILSDNINKGQGVGLKRSLSRLGMELFNDEFLRLRENLHYVEPVKDFHKALNDRVELIEMEFETYRTGLQNLLDRGGMEHGDFFRKFTDSILKRNSLDDLTKLKSFERIADPEQWFKKTERDQKMIKVAPIADELLNLGQNFFDFVFGNVRLYSTYTIVLRNYGAYRVLRFLYQSMQDYLKSNRLNLLSEINFKINQQLTSEDSMVIYEKIGQRIRAIMIDEFQDTSQIQWDNLVPLIQNNLAEGYPNLVVGDVKQAIYRFRNGRWEIMEIQVPEFKTPWMTPGEKLVDHLEFNWRSFPEIVNFNNEFFTGIADEVSTILQNYIKTYASDSSSGLTSDQYDELEKLARAPRHVYGNAAQKVPEKNLEVKGFVDLKCEFYLKNSDKSDLENIRMEWLKEKLTELFDDGYKGADIGILARGKKELGTLGHYLTLWSVDDRRFQYSSEDSLILDLSDGVQLLMAALRVRADIDPDINGMVFMNYLIKLEVAPSANSEWTASLPGFGTGPMSDKFLDLIPEAAIERLSGFFESIIDSIQLSMSAGQWPYILCFLEEVKKFEMQNGSDIPLFLQEWNDRIHKVQIQLSDDKGKIRLYTIHKSKGLEFDAVILPFADWNFEISQNDSILWVEDREDEVLKMAGPLPINYSSRLLGTSFDYAYFGEYLRNVMDNLNLLYVALTRPKQRMYINLQAPESISGKSQDEFSKPLRNTLDLFLHKYPDLRTGPVQSGIRVQKPRPQDPTDGSSTIRLTRYPIRTQALPLHLKPTFDGAQVESIGRGLIIHEMLAYVKTSVDIPSAVTRAVLAGDIRASEQSVWIELLLEITEYEPVREFYTESWNVFNEQSIMVVGGGEYRPDRVQENGLRYVVLDYKTGDPSPDHEKQILLYKSIITSMVPLPVDVYLYYPLVPKLVEIS